MKLLSDSIEKPKEKLNGLIGLIRGKKLEIKKLEIDKLKL